MMWSSPPLCALCEKFHAGFLLTTHAPSCFDCVAAVDWSRSPNGTPADVAEAVSLVATAPQSQAMLERHGQRLLLAGNPG